ncbi:pyrroline-5-carboxylate reductase [mine drainage metagenome]|uniref:Pyrroline-5-carboxylate reductase n=1 Tax=mine drainage metagenome TaxID=410659 RepID=A0A1J5S1N9_9ZZZZ
MSNIAFIGAGRMASAMVGGLISSGAARPADLACIGGRGESAKRLSETTGIRLAISMPDLLAKADAVVLACKPQQFASLDSSLVALTGGKLVLSVLAGKRLERISQAFTAARNVVRAMPNTPGQIGAGITGWCALRPLSEGDRALVTAILGSLGKMVEFDEAQLDAVTAVSGSGPAYVFEFAAALRDGGVAAGLSREAAYVLAVETILGAARLMERSTAEAEDLRNQVTSPNGTTFAGLKRMEAHGFRDTIRETVLAARDRSIELSREG